MRIFGSEVRTGALRASEYQNILAPGCGLSHAPVRLFRPCRDQPAHNHPSKRLGPEVHKAESCEIALVVSLKRLIGRFFPCISTHAVFWIRDHHLGLGSRGARRLWGNHGSEKRTILCATTVWYARHCWTDPDPRDGN